MKENKKGAFLEIASNFIKYCQQYVESTLYPWHIIPGYLPFVKEILKIMKKRSISEYTDTLQKTMIMLLNNETLLNMMVSILFKKTKLYNYYEVSKSLEILLSWFVNVSKNEKGIPANFDYTFFFQSLDKILLNDSMPACPNGFWLLYRSYYYFNQDSKHRILKIVLKNFNKYFFHWSFNIRKIIQLIFLDICCKLYEGVDLLSDTFDEECEEAQLKVAFDRRIKDLKILEIGTQKYITPNTTGKPIKKGHLNIIPKSSCADGELESYHAFLNVLSDIPIEMHSYISISLNQYQQLKKGIKQGLKPNDDIKIPLGDDFVEGKAFDEWEITNVRKNQSL